MQVPAAATAAETGLGDGGAPAHQQVGDDPGPPGGKTGTGDEQGLVESTPPQARGMEGDGQDQVRLREPVRDAGEPEETGHGGQGCCPAQELQVLDQAGHGATVKDGETGQVKAMAPLQAVTAEMITAPGKGQAATGTAGGTAEDKGGPTVRTEQGQPGRGQLAAAAKTERGKEEIPGARKKRGRQGLSRQADHMLSMMAWPKAEQESLVAPSMSRARS